MVICFAVLAVAAYFIVAAFNPKVEPGDMLVSSGNSQPLKAYSNIIEYRTKERTETLRPIIILEHVDDMPEVDCTEGLITNFTADTLDDFRFYLYSLDGTELYTARPGFQAPENSGTYIVKVVFSWGTKEKNSIVTENFFKVHYS